MLSRIWNHGLWNPESSSWIPDSTARKSESKNVHEAKCFFSKLCTRFIIEASTDSMTRSGLYTSGFRSTVVDKSPWDWGNICQVLYPFGLPLATLSEVPTSNFLLSSALLNSLFVEMYHTIAINTLCMTINGLLLPFYCCVMVGAHNTYGLLVMDISFCHHLHFLN